MPTVAIDIPQQALDDFCRKWKIREVSLFGSVLREDFGPRSDVDVMVAFEPGAVNSLLDMVDAELELAKVLGRPVDLLERSAVEHSENWIRRRRILGSARTIYAR
jgi:predicted nucleotidyltransferase